MFAASTDSSYEIAAFIHIVCAVVGLAPSIVIAFQSVSGGDLTDLAKNSFFHTYMVQTVAFIGSFITGMGLIGLSEDEFSFGDPWVSASFLVFILLLGVLHGLAAKAAKQVRAGDVNATSRMVLGHEVVVAFGILLIALMTIKPGA
jgi:hypothetical protein